MSMDFSEFSLRLGADPRSRDPEFLLARDSSPEFSEAAEQAERFERQLERALTLEAPPGLVERLCTIPDSSEAAAGRTNRGGMLWRYALAASLFLAVAAAGLTWRMSSHWSSVQDYVVDHYHHDGVALLADADHGTAEGVSAMLADFGARLDPVLAGTVSVVKKCPTPDGKGVHMVLNTERGLVTLIYMPHTAVRDGEQFDFDGQEALLVELESGSAALIGSPQQQVSQLHGLVQTSIVPLESKA